MFWLIFLSQKGKFPTRPPFAQNRENLKIKEKLNINSLSWWFPTCGKCPQKKTFYFKLRVKKFWFPKTKATSTKKKLFSPNSASKDGFWLKCKCWQLGRHSNKIFITRKYKFIIYLKEIRVIEKSTICCNWNGDLMYLDKKRD